MKAPHFSLPDQNGNMHSLSDYKGKWVILYTYPKDDTPGCTKEACGFRDSMENIKKNDIVVLGLSKDSVSSHSKFASKYSLRFPLLSDESAQTIKSYGALGEKSLFGKKYIGIFRKTFVIDPDGEIVQTYEHMDVTKHAGQVLTDIRALKQQNRKQSV